MPRQSLFSVTVVLNTYNDGKIIEECFRSVSKQNYKGKVNTLILDGGSSDETIKIAQKYKVNISIRKDLKDLPHIRAELGIKSITTDLIVLFSADNRFLENDCLRRMIEPFYDKDIVVSQTFQYGFFKNSSLLTKYFALIGGADPIAVELGKADRAPYDKTQWHSFGKVKNFKNYFEVIFENDPQKIPTLGANGIVIRNSVLKKYPIENTLHTEMCLNFIENGYNKFAFVKDANIVHEISVGLMAFCMRRLRWSALYSSDKMKRKYFVFKFPEDAFKLLGIIIAAFTIVIPTIRAFRGYSKYRHLAWFLHPFVLLIFVLSYGMQVISQTMGKIRVKS